MFDDPINRLALLVGAVVVLIAVVMWGFRRILRPSKRGRDVNFDFTIGELNDLVREGKLSGEEFEQAKAAVLKRAAAAPPKGARGFDVLQRAEGEDAGGGDSGDASRDAR